MATVKSNGTRTRGGGAPARAQVTAPLGPLSIAEITDALKAASMGDFSRRLPSSSDPEYAALALAFNSMAERNQQMTAALTRLARVVGREGRLDERLSRVGALGSWGDMTDAINSVIDDLVRPTAEVARVITAVAEGDLKQKMNLTIAGRPLRGEFLRIGTIVNSVVAQLSAFSEEVTRVAREVGTEGKLGGQAQVEGVSGTWRDLTENVNVMARNLTNQVRNIAHVATAVANGDLSQKISVDAEGEILELKNTINTMVDQLSSFADEVTRVAREVGTEGKLGGQAQVKGVSGTWRDLTESVNQLAGNLTAQVRNIAQVTTAVARGDLSQKITVEAKGEVAALAGTINTMVDQLRSFAAEVTRVAREVGTEGKLGGQAEVEGVSGTWRDLTESVNQLAGNLTAQVRNIAQVTTAVARGDLSQKITVDVKGEILELKNTINTMVDQLRSFADEVTRVAREVGTEGRLGGQAEVAGVSGTWRDLTENVNQLAGNLTAQVRNIAQVTTAVARGDLSQKITVDVKGEILELKDTINTMVDQLRSFADEVTRVSREVGTEGRLGGQAVVPGVSGTWANLTDSVNFMASNLTNQVRAIAEVTTAVANGDLTKKINVDAKGEIAELKNTINTMVDQLSSFAAEVTRVAREVGTDGKLGGQAEVEGVSGTWKYLTENVNQLAGNLTTQVRAIAEVSTAVTRGDLTRNITVEARGEVAELKDNINQMIANLRETTTKNAEQDWLKSNLARISGMLQGQRDLKTVSRLIMSELTPLVGAQQGCFYLTQPEEDGASGLLRLIAGYAVTPDTPEFVRFGEAITGQAALERKSILLEDVPVDYLRVHSSLGSARPSNIVVMPILFEEEVFGVIELASLEPFQPTYRSLLDQVVETIGVVLNTILANMRTEELLEQSQRLAHELQSRQEELQRTNEEIEAARRGLEEKAEQLALSSRYKSEFLANMSHELRTPLNSVLILARMLADNPDKNLTSKQVDYARTIYAGGSDLLALINDILDLSKIEAGRMDINPSEVSIQTLRDYVELTFRPVAEEKALTFNVEVAADVPRSVVTDEQRLQQILKNLLSNAFKFTSSGSVTLRVERPHGLSFDLPSLNQTDVVGFSVADTGIGVAEDKLRLIFEAFQQADGTTSRRYGGTGLGLAISRDIAQLLGAEIRVSSEVGRGSTFSLYLPAANPAFTARVADITGETLAVATPLHTVRAVEAIDDRDHLRAGDQLLLIVCDKPDRISDYRVRSHENGYKFITTLGGDLADLSRRYRPNAVLIDLQADETTGLATLHALKQQDDLRNAPVVFVGAEPTRQAALAGGALIHVAAPISAADLDDALGRVTEFMARRVRRVLIVDDDSLIRDQLAQLLSRHDQVELLSAATGEEALALVSTEALDCLVLDLTLPGINGLALLEEVKGLDRRQNLPVIVYTGREFTEEEEIRLRRYAQAVILKDARSYDRLLRELGLFLHLSDLGDNDRNAGPLIAASGRVTDLEGKKVLIVDDDVRNVFALASALESLGMEIVFAENGREGIEKLRSEPGVDLVLMDVMMPEMDGYATTRAVREMPEYRELPIIALTAKAMKGDRERSIESGASDYITKPVDFDALISMIRNWVCTPAT